MEEDWIPGSASSHVKDPGWAPEGRGAAKVEAIHSRTSSLLAQGNVESSKEAAARNIGIREGVEPGLGVIGCLVHPLLGARM
ncbi:hypothetical protein VE03_06610 [Pseudogymnoascus sp. 23342-1-I1]|nr:hypothetical protein VE03_06610 [Pseudogymnoascus sp. 23342-1-I1]